MKIAFCMKPMPRSDARRLCDLFAVSISAAEPDATSPSFFTPADRGVDPTTG